MEKPRVRCRETVGGSGTDGIHRTSWRVCTKPACPFQPSVVQLQQTGAEMHFDEFGQPHQRSRQTATVLDRTVGNPTLLATRDHETTIVLERQPVFAHAESDSEIRYARYAVRYDQRYASVRNAVANKRSRRLPSKYSGFLPRTPSHARKPTVCVGDVRVHAFIVLIHELLLPER